MKNIRNQYGIFMLTAMILTTSCEGMMDVHENFMKGGEVVYAPKIDSMSFYAGQNQVYFEFWTYNATNVKTVDLYWDEDSLIIPVSPTSGYDNVRVEVPCVEEKSYTFKVRTTDVFGNHSLWSTGFANSYGDFFMQSLSNRMVKGFSVAGNDGTITWYPPASNMARCEVRYTDNTGRQQILSVPANESTTPCPGLTNNQFDVRSYFLPEPNAIDTFVMAWEPMTPLYQYPRTGWSIKYCNSWHGMPSLTGSSDMPHFIIDGNFSTFWHSRYSTYTAGTSPWDPNVTRDPPPFTIVIDMGETLDVEQVDVYRRLSNNNAQTVIVYASAIDDNLLTNDDFEWRGNTPVTYTNHSFFFNYRYPGVPNDHWVELGRVEYPSDAQATAEQNLRSVDASTKDIRSRYIKLVLPNTRSNGNVSLCELFVWGR